MQNAKNCKQRERGTKEVNREEIPLGKPRERNLTYTLVPRMASAGLRRNGDWRSNL